MSSEPMNADKRQPVQFQTDPQCGARTKSGKPCRSPATKKERCRLHGGASGSGRPPDERNGQYRHGERTKVAIAERQRVRVLARREGTICIVLWAWAANLPPWRARLCATACMPPKDFGIGRGEGHSA